MEVTNELVHLINYEDCKIILNNYCKESTPNLLSYKILKISDKVVGFLGDHFRLVINYSVKGGKFESTSFFVKTLPVFNQNQKEYCTKMDVLYKECLIYKNILNKCLQFNGKPFAPKAYLIKPSQCLVLEDLCLKGYSISNNNYFNDQQIEALMKTLSRFHASSLIYEKIVLNNKKINEKFTIEIRETTFSFIDDHPRCKWLHSTTQCIIDVINLLPDLRNKTEICKKLKTFLLEESKYLLKPSKIYSNVLCHDDLWCNNILFNNNRKDCMLVDFQLTRYTPPAMDILLALYINVDHSHLENNLKKFLNIYYQSLENELKHYELNAEDLLPKNELHSSLEYYSLLALVEAVMYGTNTFVGEELSNLIVSDINVFKEYSFINRSKFITKEYIENTTFRERFNCVLLPLVRKLEELSS